MPINDWEDRAHASSSEASNILDDTSAYPPGLDADALDKWAEAHERAAGHAALAAKLAREQAERIRNNKSGGEK